MFNYKFLFGLFLVIFLFNVSTKVEAQEASVSSRQIDEIIVTSRTVWALTPQMHLSLRARP